jgi:hypothetical protein
MPSAITLFGVANPGTGSNINNGDVKGFCQASAGPYPSCLQIDAWMCYDGSPMTTLATPLSLPNSVPVYAVRLTGVLTQLSATYTDMLLSSAPPALFTNFNTVMDNFSEGRKT